VSRTTIAAARIAPQTTSRLSVRVSQTIYFVP
jgi:hypothetical protein